MYIKIKCLSQSKSELKTKHTLEMYGFYLNIIRIITIEEHAWVLDSSIYLAQERKENRENV